MHVFFRDYQISKEKCEKLNKKDLPTFCNHDDEEESGENIATGQSISVHIMFPLSWLVIYNIWKHQETERDEKEEGLHKSNNKWVTYLI